MNRLAYCCVIAAVFAACSSPTEPASPDANLPAADARAPDPTARWQPIGHDDDAKLTGVFVDTSGDVWLAGASGLRQRSAGAWQPWLVPPGEQARPSYDVYANASGVYVSRTPELLRYADGEWSTVGAWNNCAWEQVPVGGAGDAVFAGCPYYAGFARWGDQAFTLAQEQIIIYDLVAVSTTDVIVAGSLGVYAYTGFELGTDTRDDWQLIFEPDGFIGFPALWADASGAIVLLGNGGTAFHGTRQGLTPVATPSDVQIRGVFGTRHDDLFAVGDGGAIWHFDGDAWTAMDSGTSADLHGIHGSADGLELWVVGDAGTVLRLQR